MLLPGGFSYGDYLRCGAIARFAPVMADVRRFADDGGPVLGICNGFQILCEAGLLPGVLRPNASLSFVCRDVAVRVERADLAITGRCAEGQVLTIPIKCGEGAWYADEALVDALECGRADRLPLRRREPDGRGRRRRGRLQRGRERRRAHAAPRARGRPDARLRRRRAAPRRARGRGDGAAAVAA